MANPRNLVGFEGIADEADYLTFKYDNSTIAYDSTKARGAAAAMLDKAVTLSADATVALCADGDAVAGKLYRVEPDGKCLVQYKGCLSLPGGASATLTRGNKVVGALGAASAKGYIRDAASGTAAEIVKGRGLILDKSDLTAVVVGI